MVIYSTHDYFLADGQKPVQTLHGLRYHRPSVVRIDLVKTVPLHRHLLIRVDRDLRTRWVLHIVAVLSLVWGARGSVRPSIRDENDRNG